MKNLHKLILILLISNLSFSQTYIPMPVGYGINDGNGNNLVGASKPFYELNGYIYCYTTLLSAVPTGTNYGTIAKVNATTNQVSILTGTIGGDEKPYDLKIYNGNIYFKTDGYNFLYQINTSTNELINFSQQNLNNSQVFNYSINQNKIFFVTTGGGSRIYNFGNNLVVNLTYNNPFTNTIEGLILSNYYSYNNFIYCTGRTESQTLESVFKINTLDNQVIIVALQPNASGQFGYFDGTIINENISALRINNYLVFCHYDYIANIFKYEALNINTESFNSNFFTKQPNTFSYVLNNQIFINQGNQVYVSDGSNAPILTNLPAFSSGRAITSNKLLPLSQTGNTNIFNNGNCVVGERNVVPYASYELWSNNGTFANNFRSFSSIYQFELHSMLEINNKTYFLAINGAGAIQEIYQSDRTNSGTFSIFNFNQINSNGTGSNLINSGNNIFFSSTRLDGTNIGLYKLDTTTLATTSLNLKDKFSISPNPTNSTLTIQTQEKIKTINIIDLLGRKTNITNFENNKIDVSNLQNGVYFLEIETENGLQTQKFIKN
jgi:Secretion system C-terminal sorting domain